MASTLTLYDAFKLYIADGTLDLNSNNFKATLHTGTYSPSISAHTIFAHCTNEVATGNGYTAAGTVTETTVSTPFCGQSTGSAIVASYGFAL
jgi:hypothetical protein